MTRFPALRAHGDAPVLTLFRNLGSSPKGLTENEAAERLRRFGENRIGSTLQAPVRVWTAARSPFVALLTALGLVFAGVGDIRGAVTVGVMVVLSIGLRYWQQSRSERAISAVRDQITTTVTVRRRAAAEFPGSEREVPTADLVPGDVVLLGPGDVIPADVRIVAAKDFVVDQSALSGEALPVAKRAPQPGKHEDHELVETPALGFAGTSVVGGTATAVVAATGSDTYFGVLAKQSAEPRAESSFDAGVRRVGWTLVRFMLVMVPIVLVVNGTVTGDWAQAGMFAVAVAVGLTPEMLPVIVTTNLARGAAALSRRQVIVKRLNAIQDLAAMDVLCVDKTGTLTEDRIAYAHSVDYSGSPDGEAAEYAGLAVRFQTDRHDRLDEAIETLFDGEDDLVTDALFTGVAEIGFDHARRRASVVVRRGSEYLLISKGDPDEILPRCSHARRDGVVTEFDDAARIGAEELVRAYAEHGMRVLAVAAREVENRLDGFDETDENQMILVGFVGFVDPVRDGVVNAVKTLGEQGVALKVLTGDNRHVAARVADSAGIPVGEVVLGRQVEAASDAELREIVKDTTVFAKLTPAHKARVVTALRENGRAVGFVGDGVNDVTALRTADVGIAPDTATDAAKDAADLVLLERDLGVLARGVAEGRRTLGNTLKYVNITAASNFGNVLSVLAASAFLPLNAHPADPARGVEPALRPGSARAGLGPGGRRVPRQAAPLGRARADRFHARVRPAVVAVRPRDVRRAVARLRGGSGPVAVPDRLVRRGAALAAAGRARPARPRHSHARQPPGRPGRRGRRARRSARAAVAARRTVADAGPARDLPAVAGGRAGRLRAGGPSSETRLGTPPYVVVTVLY
ncbi:magnesium-translocating P-type ATPase [Streptomyces sp. AA4]|nr:magnesium-translocating P-type ATPase [Streptomyces sp. AA4]EFL08471.1 magnesium-translocating P-type ATPase [Streptomyces sp. AA4]